MITLEWIIGALIALITLIASWVKFCKKEHHHDHKKEHIKKEKKEKKHHKKEKKCHKKEHDHHSESEKSERSESESEKSDRDCRKCHSDSDFSKCSSSSESEKDFCRKGCDDGKIRCCPPIKPTHCDIAIVFQRECLPCNVNPPIICNPCTGPQVLELITSNPCFSSCNRVILENLKHIIELAKCKNPCLNVHLIDVGKKCNPTKLLRKFHCEKKVKVFILLTPCAVTFRLLPFFHKYHKKKVVGIDIVCGSTTFGRHDGIIKLIANANAVATALAEVFINILTPHVTDVLIFDYLTPSEVDTLLQAKLIEHFGANHVFTQTIDFCKDINTQLLEGIAKVTISPGTVLGIYFAFTEADLSVVLNKGIAALSTTTGPLVAGPLCAFPELTHTVSTALMGRLYSLARFFIKTPETEHVLHQLRLCVTNVQQAYAVLVLLDALEVASRYCATKCIEKARHFTGLTGNLEGECDGSLRFWWFLLYQLACANSWKPFAVIGFQPAPLGLVNILVE